MSLGKWLLFSRSPDSFSYNLNFLLVSHSRRGKSSIWIFPRREYLSFEEDTFTLGNLRRLHSWSTCCWHDCFDRTCFILKSESISLVAPLPQPEIGKRVRSLHLSDYSMQGDHVQIVRPGLIQHVIDFGLFASQGFGNA